MAYAGTPTGLAKQPATSTLNGLWQAFLIMVVLFALAAATALVGTNLAAKGSGAAVPLPAQRDDQTDPAGGGIFLAPADSSTYNAVEQARNGTSLVPAVHYPDVSYDQVKLAPAPTVSGTAPDNHPGRVKGHRGAMIDQ